MRVLDLYCGAGGAAMGYHLAGFEVVGVDISPQPNYPFHHIQQDVTAWEKIPAGFDLIHASPPCQRFSTMTKDQDAHPDLVETTRELLQASGLPYVMENVPGAPLRRDLMLCGSMFALDVQRHRIFEIAGFTAAQPICDHTWTEGRPWTITGDLRPYDQRYPHSWKPSFDRARVEMQMPWAKTVREVTEAIPPVFTNYIGDAYMAQAAVAA